MVNMLTNNLFAYSSWWGDLLIQEEKYKNVIIIFSNLVFIFVFLIFSTAIFPNYNLSHEHEISYSGSVSSQT